MKQFKAQKEADRGIRNISKNLILEPSYEILLDKNVSGACKKEVIENLNKHRDTMDQFEERNADHYYKLGKEDGVLKGMLIGEACVIGGYVLGATIKFIIDKIKG